MAQDVSRMTLEPHRSGRFEEIKIGEAFYMRGDFWVKTGANSGHELVGLFDVDQEKCLIDPKARINTVIIGRS